MRSPCDPPVFDENDWSQFDFSRWHADGVPEDEAGQVIADLATQFFQSEEWSTHFKATLPEVKDTVRTAYQAEVQDLRQERQEAERDFKQRLSTAEERARAVMSAAQASASPPILQAREDSFQVAVRFVEGRTKLGLPEMTARLTDMRDPARVIQEASTDRDGNAVLVLSPETAKELNNIHVMLQVVAPNGNVLDPKAADICVRLNGTETHVVTVKRSQDIEGPVGVAAAVQAASGEQQKHVLARSERLKTGLTERLKDIDCRIREVETLIRQMEKPGDFAGPKQGPATAQAKATQARKRPVAAQEPAAPKESKRGTPRKKPGRKGG